MSRYSQSAPAQQTTGISEPLAPWQMQRETPQWSQGLCDDPCQGENPPARRSAATYPQASSECVPVAAATCLSAPCASLARPPRRCFPFFSSPAQLISIFTSPPATAVRPG